MRFLMERYQKNKKFLALVLLIVVLIIVGLLVYKNANNNKVPQGWTRFKDTKYGIQFDYPTDWAKNGAPKMSEIYSRGQNDFKGYLIYLHPADNNKDVKTQISLTLQKSDNSYEVCAGTDGPGEDCKQVKPVTEGSINDKLQNKSGLVAYDKNSYALLYSQPEQGLVNGVDAYQIVKLKKINVTAVKGSYYSFADSSTKISCPKDKFSQDGSHGCITQQIYNNLNELLKSIRAI